MTGIRYILGESTDPFFNLAAEEYVLYNLKECDYIMLWQNANTVVIGRHQNAGEEVDLRRAEELGVTVVRRNTGGGAVYHDMGNLNFSYITQWRPESQNYDVFLKPVIRALVKFGVPAEKQGRNDLVAGDRKISGNAQCVHGGRILHHGTLLVNSDLSVMPQVLSAGSDKIESKGIKSVRSRVANIAEFSDTEINVEILKHSLIESFALDADISEYVFSDDQLSEIKRLADAKYSSWEWNIGSFAKYTYKNAIRFPCGKIEVRLNVVNGVIEECRIFGDFLALTGVETLEEALKGCRTDKGSLTQVLSGFDLTRLYGFSQDELLLCFE